MLRLQGIDNSADLHRNRGRIRGIHKREQAVEPAFRFHHRLANCFRRIHLAGRPILLLDHFLAVDVKRHGPLLRVLQVRPCQLDNRICGPGDVVNPHIEAAGGKMADVVKITVFVTDIAHRDDFSKAREEYFPGRKPCSSLIGIKSLARPGLVIEVEAIAVIGAGE